MKVLDLGPIARASGAVKMPGSKSISNRVLLLAALSRGETLVRDLLDADDTRVMLEALARLGIEVARVPGGLEVRGAAGGFRDFTRIASSHPEMWRDISIANRKALLADLERYAQGLARVRRMLARGDGKALEALFSGAREARDRWLKSRE